MTIDDKYKKLEIFTFDSGVEGPTFTTLGGVHGNEPCGPEALQRILEAIEAGKIKITKGKFVTIPVCNPLAREQNVRFVERNLNRFLYVKNNPQAYEDFLDIEICPVLDETDFLLDIHSYQSQGEAFVFLGKRDEDNIGFARSLDIPRIIFGWAEAMAGNDDMEDKRQAIGTTEYVRDRGKVGITVECGTHDHPRAADVAFNCVLKAMQHLGIAEIDNDLFITDLPESEPYDIKMGGVFLHLRAGQFTQEWRNMQPVKQGEVLARYEDGEELIMPQDGFVVLPAKKATLNDGWFFWGTPEAL